MAKIAKARGYAGLKSATFKAKSFAGRPPAPAALPKPHGDPPTRCKVRFSGFGGGGREETFLRIYTISKDMGIDVYLNDMGILEYGRDMELDYDGLVAPPVLS